MKSTSVKGLPKVSMGFKEYTGNVVSKGGALPKPHTATKSKGGKVTNNLKKTAVRKKLG